MKGGVLLKKYIGVFIIDTLLAIDYFIFLMLTGIITSTDYTTTLGSTFILFNLVLYGILISKFCVENISRK
jgi:hypothetical protein